MSVLSVITLLGFGFGSALAVILFTLFLQRTPKQHVDFAFGVLFASFVLWFGGNFLALLVQWLFGSVARPTIQVLMILAYAGLTITPSSLLHIQLTALLAHRKESQSLATKYLVLIVVFYLPVLVFLMSRPVQIVEGIFQPGQSNFINKPFVLWMIFTISVSITFSEKLIHALKHKADRSFYRDLSYVLTGIGLGLIVIYVFALYKLPYIGAYLDLFMLLSPAIPLLVFLYYVYRYNFYRLVIKPSVVYSIIYGSVMAIYLLGIRRLGEYLRTFPEVNEQFIEGLLLVALVFAFQPFRSALQSRLDRYLFKDRYYYQQFLRELTDSISGIVDLNVLINTLRKALVDTLKVKMCTIIILSKEPDESRFFPNQQPYHLPDLSLLIRALETTHPFRLRRTVRDPRVISALQKNKLALAIPVYFQDEMRGVICLSEKESSDDFSDEELDVLSTFANQIGLAIENARLVQERLELIRRVYQAEKMNSLGQLATTMSHELKNPLSSIKTIVQILHEKASGEDKKDLQLVVNEIDRLNAILEKLLSFARPSVGTTEKVEIVQIVEDVLSLLKPQARKAGIKVTFERNDSIPSLYIQVQLIREIVFNLVLNAIQAMEGGGGIYLSLQVRNEDKQADGASHCLVLTVSDDGPGIPDEILNRIYEPFYTSKTVGTGLGLAIVKRNVEEWGGDIHVTSHPGGTTFEISLPIDEMIHNEKRETAS